MSIESKWQEKITGEWYGCPSVFDGEGKHLGFNKVSRSSVFEDGRTTYRMQTELEVAGPLRARFEAPQFAFGVRDDGQDRVYVGPDFYGAGRPYGRMVDAHYYSPAWSADLKTMVHILADGKTQVYSSLIFEGPKLVSVFNGLYLMATDYDTNPETKTRIDAFVAAERRRGNNTHITPMKEAGAWDGDFEVYDDRQELVGTTHVHIDYQPTTLRQADVRVSVEGAYNYQASYTRAREGMRHDFHGPDLYGNGIAFGRALYTSAHVRGQALTLKARDFIIDDKMTMSSVWQFTASGKTTHTLFGVLKWAEREKVLTPQY